MFEGDGPVLCASVPTTEAVLGHDVRCRGHIDRRIKPQGDTPKRLLGSWRCSRSPGARLLPPAASGVTGTGTVPAVVMVLSGVRWADSCSLRRSYGENKATGAA